MFRGVFMRDALPKKPWKTEIGILNLDSLEGKGTHWTLWSKADSNYFYFDSFGHGPPIELSKYLNNDIIYSTFQVQEMGTEYCGQLCLILLANLVKFQDFQKSILEFL